MIANGSVRFLAPEVRGDQFAALTRPDLYSQLVGLEWEASDILSVQETIF